MLRHKRNNQAFTLIELVAAVAILGVVIATAGLIFNVSIDTQRAALANAEIMQNFQVIVTQLNDDFKGLRPYPAPVADCDPANSDPNHIAFIANGDFQSIEQYPSGGNDKTVAGNVAAILYTCDDNDPNILIRRQTILTKDDSLSDPNEPSKSEYSEYTLSEIVADEVDDYVDTFDWSQLPPSIDLDIQDDLVMYVTDNVSEFGIEYADGFDGDKIKWKEPDDSFPDAIKFTFTLRDSSGIVKGGRRFTYIVYTAQQ